jgi:S-adenosylmethionine:tRNA ribosyltransferase-isomerase
MESLTCQRLTDGARRAQMRPAMADLRTSDFDFELPESAIAKRPPENRHGGRLLVLDRKSGAISHRKIVDLPELLGNELIVVNDSKVIPARFYARRQTGGRVEVLLIEKIEQQWTCMLKASKRPKEQELLHIIKGANPDATEAADLHLGALRICAHLGGGRALVEFTEEIPLEEIGQPPLPPYIDRATDKDDWNRYQTVYAANDGSVAAPTAGLHLSEEVLAGLGAKGCELAKVTLHVGPGTFVPVRSERVNDHKMEEERYVVSAATAERIAAAGRENRRILAVGTTSVRTLESSKGMAGQGRSELFISPGYSFQVVEALLTNFHLPRSTLLMLVSAFAGRERVLAAYREAVAEGYRFYSYGDAMLIR